MTVLNDVKNLNGHIAISGAFYGGYWNDGVGKDSRVFCTDCFRIIHSYRSYIAGMRVYANPSPFPLRFVNPFMGLSYHFVHANYVGSYGHWRSFIPVDPARFSRNDFRYDFGAFDAGLRLIIPVTDRLVVVGEAQRYLGYFHRPKTRRVAGRKSVTLGFSFSF